MAVDHPNGVVQYGGTVSAPIAKSFLQTAIEVLDLPPTDQGMEREYNWMDTKYVILPNVVGMNLEDAKKALKGFQVEYSGTGDKINYQSPKGGYYIKEGGTVKLMLE